MVCVEDTLTTWGYAAQCRALTDRCLLRKIIRNPIGRRHLGQKKKKYLRIQQKVEEGTFQVNTVLGKLNPATEDSQLLDRAENKRDL